MKWKRLDRNRNDAWKSARLHGLLWNYLKPGASAAEFFLQKHKKNITSAAENIFTIGLSLIVIVIVDSWFLERPQKRSHRNQLIHRRLFPLNQKKIDRQWSRSRESGRQTDGYGGWCMELRRGGSYGECMMNQDRICWRGAFPVWSERAVERWQGERFVWAEWLN